MVQKCNMEQLYDAAEQYYLTKGLPALGSFETFDNGCFVINFFAALANKKLSSLPANLQKATLEMKQMMKQERQDNQIEIFQKAIQDCQNKTELGTVKLRIERNTFLTSNMKKELLLQLEDAHTQLTKPINTKEKILENIRQYQEGNYAISIYAVKARVKKAPDLSDEEKTGLLQTLEEIQKTIPAELRCGIQKKHYRKKDEKQIINKEKETKKKAIKEKEEKTKIIFFKKLQFCLSYAEQHNTLPSADIWFPEELEGKSAYAFWRTLRYEKNTPKKYMQWRDEANQLLSPYYSFSCTN